MAPVVPATQAATFGEILFGQRVMTCAWTERSTVAIPASVHGLTPFVRHNAARFGANAPHKVRALPFRDTIPVRQDERDVSGFVNVPWKQFATEGEMLLGHRLIIFPCSGGSILAIAASVQGFDPVA